MLLPIALALAAGGVIYAGARIAQPFFGRRVCPACRRRRVEPDPEQQRGLTDDDAGHHGTAYRCRHCNAQWFSTEASGLLTREAFDAAMRAPLPTAIVRTAPQDER
jgi:hypothetical protein